jgi:hypothetical protein
VSENANQETGSPEPIGMRGDPSPFEPSPQEADETSTPPRTGLRAPVVAALALAGTVLLAAAGLLAGGVHLAYSAAPRSTVTATSSVAAAPSIGALMSSTDPNAAADRLGAFAAETVTDSSSADAGPAGADGAAGVDGVDGAEGPPGADGADGAVGATGPAGFGLTVSDEPTQSVAIWSPDGTSYGVIVRNSGIYLQGPTTTQVWSDTSHFQIPVQ